MQKQSTGLTKRELQVATFLARGLKSKEVAENLDISKRTIDFHIQRIYGKLQVDNRVRFLSTFMKLYPEHV